MDLELLAIGTELLLGFTVDTNSGEIARMLGPAGVRITRRTAIADDPALIREAIEDALRRTGAVITTGGLGPTRDDITKKTVADLFDAPLEFHPAIWDRLVERFAGMGRTIPESNRCQAEVPRGADALENRRGTAPGLWLEDRRGLVIMLPGVPVEMRGLMRDHVVPRLAGRSAGAVIESRTLRTSGIAESALAERLGDIETAIAPVTLAYLPALTGVDLRLTAWGLPRSEAAGQLDRAAGLVRPLAGRYLYGEGDTDLAEVLLARARAGGHRIAVAESCTGGMVGARLTAVPGASDVFVGGVLAYSNAVKTGHLEVDPALVERHGAVSEPVCVAMARGVARRFHCDLAMAVTGIAGPDGGTPDKPVGTVWFASLAGDQVRVRSVIFPGSREEVRIRSAQSVLLQLYRLLSGDREE